ncbi:M20/M25/M40 family metallo-hydrolase [Infirmifilum sp. NZ]|uniref:M20/M25/M40 family metallo-hydrolase n=1 Tax=Infirmifilum sp. NZ TaxID=2926850 RepID=UPI0027A4D053|nr:M20/M25/M40 family metallo-hydrolase [Infirmifilum sp. NZ]UNQ73662.1 M20/M25/M40 family metallo-hydrolase [Infirmifilum sp. NZ]
MDPKVAFVADMLSELIRVDTTNPPGNETPAAKLIAEALSGAGVEYKLLESAPNRGSIVAWAESNEPGPSLLLLSHLDVVPANPEEWSVDPFSGLVKDGFIWGRGAVDDKLSVAVMLRVFLDFVESRRFKGRLIYAATADEEMGGRMGAGWLVEKHPELVKAEYVLNEGGGFEVPGKRGSVFLVQTAEKGVYWFKLAFKGSPGHASMPRSGDNAVLKASEAAARLASRQPPLDVKPYVKLMLERMLESQGVPAPLRVLLTSRLGLPMLLRSSWEIAPMLDAMLRNTMAPTVIRGGEKVNVIPSSCELSVDCRLLPGYGEDWVRGYIAELLRGISYELKFIHTDGATESPVGTRLYKAIEEAVAAESPGSRIAPYMSTGGTDSRFFRSAFGSKAYGFVPLRSDLPLKELFKMVHGVDERVSLRNVEFSYKTTRKVLEAFYSQ